MSIYSLSAKKSPELPWEGNRALAFKICSESRRSGTEKFYLILIWNQALVRLSIHFSISDIFHALHFFDSRIGAGNLSSSISLYTVDLEIQHNARTSLILIIFCSIVL